MTRLKSVLLCGAALTVPAFSPALAQQNDASRASSDAITDDTAGVVAPIDAAEAGRADPDQITVVGKLTDVVIARDRIDLLQANDLRDLFRQVPSVTVGGSLGIAQKIYVRGLEDSQLNVTIDGAPQHGTLFHHVGRVSLEPEILEQVELKAGPGEATAGFGAIGGAIRFRTRDPVDMLDPGKSVGGIVKGGWFSNDGYKLSGTLYGRLFGDVGVLGSYVYSDRNDFEDGDGNELRGTSAEQHLGFIKIGGDIGLGHRFSLSYERRDEKGEFGVRPNWPVLLGDDLFPVEAERQTVTGNYGYQSAGIFSAELTAYWTNAEFVQDRYDRWGRYGAEIESYGFDARARFDTGKHDIVVGFEHRNDAVMSQYLADPAMWQPWAWDPSIGRFEEDGALFGVYIQDHWRVFDPLLLSFGARYDAYDLDQVTYGDGTNSDGVSFNVGADYEILPGLTLNAGYAEAFRGKEIGDAFTLEKRPGTLSLQPNLQPERVGNLEIGASFQRGGFTASAAYFDMEIEDVILDQLYGANYYENAGDFTSEGFELRAAYEHGPFRLSGFYNHYDSRLNGNRINGYDHIALGNTMGDNWNVTAGFAPSRSFDLEASVTRFDTVNNLEALYRDAEFGYIPSTVEIDKPGYTVVDILSRWSPMRDGGLTLYAGIYNLFDKQYIAHASVADYSDIPGFGIVSGVPEPGRNIRLSASYRF